MVRVRTLAHLLVAGTLVTATGCGGAEKRAEEAAKQQNAKAAKQRALLTEAREAVEAGEFEDADKAYRRAFAVANDLDVLEEHVMYLIAVGRTTDATEVAEKYYNANTTDPKGYELYAETLIAGGKGEQASEVASQMVRFDDKNPAGYEKRGRAHVLLGRVDEGLVDLQKAVELDPESATYHTALGLAMHGQKRFNEAGIELLAALKRNPNDSMANALVGMARRDQGFDDDAKMYFDRAIEIDSKNGRAWFELGLLYNRQQKQAEAENALARAVQYSPYESRFWYGYGEIYRLQERDDEAVAAYKKAVDLDPPHPKALPKLITLMIDRDELDEAEEIMAVQTDRYPEQANVLLPRADLFVAQKKWKLATEAYQKYLAVAPEADPERDRVQAQLVALKKKK